MLTKKCLLTLKLQGGGEGENSPTFINIVFLVHVRKENVLLNIHVNLVYKKLDA